MLTGEPERKLRGGTPAQALLGLFGGPEPPCTPPGISDSQSCTAALKTGELSLGFSCSMWTPPPENVGSGKFGTPWERMQAAALRYCACSAPVSAGPGCRGRRRAGACRQASWAGLEVGFSQIAGGDRHLDAHSAAVFGDLSAPGSWACRGRACRRCTRPPELAGDASWPAPDRGRGGRRGGVGPDVPDARAEACDAPARRSSATARDQRADEERRGAAQPARRSLRTAACAPVRSVAVSALHVVSFAARKAVAGLLVRHARFRERIAARRARTGTAAKPRRNRREVAGAMAGSNPP